MYISIIAIREAYRQIGIGKNFLEIVIAKTKSLNIPYICLHVWTQNTNAICFYEKMGFITDNYIENYYSKKRDAYRMKLVV